MKPEIRQEFEKQIRERLRALDDEDAVAAGNRGTVVLDQQSVGRLSRMDALQQQAMAKATHARRAAERARLQLALKRAATDEFGYCADCGEAIDHRRLAMNPALTLCISCMRG
ncbi:TraR/DksA family transcriptional regulator [Oceanibium sediminis]|uniref:TraR/DksA family transcriptional regulator n=1 Tax=Oceanibium sediminis TaxID=2026339 RepID=UPI000DD4AF57|nr:TraR/DksA C4-type zinc finger protein [Oceanibium sediminis]